MIQPIPIEAIPIQSEDQWLALRQNDVTASVAGALLGVHEYTTAYGLWAQKTGAAQDAAPEPLRFSDDETSFRVSDLERGKLLEPVALALISKARPTWKISAPGAYYRDPEARLGATPDALAIDPARAGTGVLQIKTVSEHAYRRKWRDPDTLEIELPLWIAVQAAVEAELTGASWAAVGAMVVDHKLTMHLIDIPLSRGLIERVRAEVSAFWALVEAGETPPLDYRRDGRVLARVLAQDDGDEIDLSGDARLQSLLAERAERSSRKSDDDEALKAINCEILAKLGNAALARCGQALISAKTVRRKEYLAKATSYRALRVKMETDHAQ
jgi:predicted phage-related endonuclease